MGTPFSIRRERVLATLLVFLGVLSAQQTTPAPPDPTKLSVDAATLPTASPRHPYKFQFQAHGGIPPMKYAVAPGSTLPAGMTLSDDGLLTGTVPKIGEYRFTISVTDSSRPPQTSSRVFVLRAVAPMLMQWKRYATVSGNRVDGSVVVSNSTEDDFDFTFIVLAVAENGRATAIGYQHVPLKSGVDSQEIPFGETLPRGAYMVHVDGVAEVPEKDLIYRARLQTKDRLQVTVGP
jgi:putative Ig domain-containing protein